eukprot:160843_1
MQHMSVAESMIVGFAWQYYLPNQLDYNDISKSYSKEMLNLVGNNLRIFVDEYNLQIKKFPRDVTQGPCVDSNPPSLPLTTQEVEDYLQIIFKSNEWKSKLTDLKYFICDPHYNPMGKKQITKTFQCHKTKDRLYRFLYDLECRLPNTLHHPPETELESSKREPLNDIHNTATNTRDGRSESMCPMFVYLDFVWYSSVAMYIGMQIQKLKRDLTTLNQQIGVDKLQIDCLNKTIIRLEKQIVKLQTFHGMKTSDLKERIQQRFIHDPVSFKQFVVDLSKSKALRKNIKVIETKDEIKSSVVEQDTYQIQGNRIRIALQTVRGKMSNESIDGMKNAIDGVPVLCLNKNEAVTVQYEYPTKATMTSTQVTALVHKWLNCHPYYKHEYGLYSNGLDTFAWQKPHSTLSDPAECMRQYLGLCISNPITSTTFRHHLKNNVKSFIPVLIGKIDGFPSCCYTYRSCTAFSLSWSGWYNNSNYHNIPYTLCADNDDQNILYIRHEVERLQTINNKRDLIVPYNGDHYRVSFRDTPIMVKYIYSYAMVLRTYGMLYKHSVLCS